MAKAVAGVPLGLGPCAGDRKWQLGFSGALFTTVNGTVVSVAPKLPANLLGLDLNSPGMELGWRPSWFVSL